MSEPAKCRSCGAAIIWAETPAGKKMPMDAEPAVDGDWFFQGDKVFKHLKIDETPAPPLHKSHFSSCQNAAQHRKPK